MAERSTPAVRAGSVVASSLGVGTASGACGGVSALVIWLVVATFAGEAGAVYLLLFGGVVALVIGAGLGAVAAVVLGFYLWVVDAIRHGAAVFSVAAALITALVMAAMTSDGALVVRAIVVALSAAASARITRRLSEGTILAR